jgi:hypothetical protein
MHALARASSGMRLYARRALANLSYMAASFSTEKFLGMFTPLGHGMQ